MAFLSEGLALMWLHSFEAYRRLDFLESFPLKFLFILPLAFAESLLWMIGKYPILQAT